jgi:hypothetical protein
VIHFVVLYISTGESGHLGSRNCQVISGKSKTSAIDAGKTQIESQPLVKITSRRGYPKNNKKRQKKAQKSLTFKNVN